MFSSSASSEEICLTLIVFEHSSSSDTARCSQEFYCRGCRNIINYIPQEYGLDYNCSNGLLKGEYNLSAIRVQLE